VEAIRPIPVDSDYWERGQGLVALARILERDSGPSSPSGGPGSESYSRALKAVSQGNFESALTALSECLAASSSNREQAAGELSRAVFKTLAFRHPLTQRFQPEIARLLYS
jgi:hypothetical protein